jgi:hypothetical protein
MMQPAAQGAKGNVAAAHGAVVDDARDFVNVVEAKDF